MDVTCGKERYRVLGRIGEGAHGVVMKAKHIKASLSVPSRQRLPSAPPLLCRYVTPINSLVLSFLESMQHFQTGELVALKKVPLRQFERRIPNSALRYSKIIP